jgi:hypothetical protein
MGAWWPAPATALTSLPTSALGLSLYRLGADPSDIFGIASMLAGP